MKDKGTNTLRGLLHSNALDLGPHGVDNGYGYGLAQLVGSSANHGRHYGWGHIRHR
jgi:hypothetical protein